MRSTFRFLAGISCLALIAGVMAPVAESATVPAGYSETQIVGGLASPTAMAFAPDGRLFVAQQGGQLRVIKDGALLAAPFVSVSVNADGERGLLGIAFDPNFATNQYLYLYYTVPSPLHNRVSRFTANGDVVVAGSERILLELNGLSSASNHNGGALHFGLDGKLYIAVGDNANSANSQTLTTLLGKVLRLNADGAIPSDNPFYGTATGNNRAIWALGLRNPFTFAFDAFSGRMFINDVGEATYEEINEGVAGANYGWPTTEGPTSNPSFRGPLYAYTHGSGGFQGCAITGGTFYNPGVAHFPASMLGSYFFADYCTGWINRLDPANNNAVTPFATGISSPVDIELGLDGRLYYLARGSGAVFRIDYTGSQAPSITQHPANQTKPVGQPATFSVVASGDTPLTYQWQRNGANISGATSASYTLASVTVADNGARFRCVVSNNVSTATSNEATLTVMSDLVVSITQPTAGTLYSGGNTIAYAGTATEGGTSRPASAFTWYVDFHHDVHTHPHMLPTTSAMSGTFTIPTSGETSANVWYRIYLTVTNSQGLATTVFRDVRPRTATVSLATVPSGGQVTLDGQPFTAPYTFTGVVGVMRTIGVPSPQTLGGSSYAFRSWSDGGVATHGISTPSTTTTLTATFDPVSAPPPVTTTTLSPTGLTVVTGTLSGGSAAYLANDNNGFMSVSSTTNGTRTTAWYGSFTGVSASLTNLRVNYSGDNSNSCTQTVAIWRWTDSMWVQLDSRTVSAEVAINNLIPGGTLANYVSTTGNGELRVRVQCTTTINFTARGDFMRIAYDLPTGAPPSDTTAPVRTNGAPSGTLAAGTTQTTLSLTTNEAATCKYGPGAGTTYAALPTTFTTTGNTTHAVQLTGLTNGSNYTHYVRCQDASANLNTNADGYVIAFSVATATPPPPAAPTLSSRAPTSGPVGTSVTVTGTNFGASQGASTITFNGTLASPTSWNATSIVASVPASATTGPVVVTVGGQTSNGLTFTVTAPPPPPPPSGGLVAAFGFEEASGVTVTDVSGNGNTGTITAATRTASGKYGRGLTFNGTTAYVRVPDAASLDLGATGTIAAWVYQTAVSNHGGLVHKGQASNFSDEAYSLQFNGTSRRPELWLTSAGTSKVATATPAGALSLATWHHVAVTWDSTGVKVYINGALNTSVAGAFTPRNSTGALFLGAQTPGQYGMAGSLDEVKIYNRALSLAEVQAAMNAPVGP